MLAGARSLPGILTRRFEAVIFDWDGTAVPDRHANALAVRGAVESACALGLQVAIVSGTHLDNVDGQLAARPRGPGELHLLLNRGSEVFRVERAGPALLQRREASVAEQAALDAAASHLVELLAGHGVEARIVSQRLNRRKIDLIPTPEWADPPKAQIAALLAAVQARLRAAGVDGLSAAVALGEQAALAAGLGSAHVTSDAKHVEIGLTDKSDSARWWFSHLWRSGVWAEQVLIVGDELGPLGGLSGSDSRLLVPEAAGACAVSVGAEPGGVPPGVIHLGGGPARLLELLRAQVARRREGVLPLAPGDPHWTLRVSEVSDERERASESLLTLADGSMGTRGSVLSHCRASRPGVVIAGVYRGHGEHSQLQRAPQWNRIAGNGFARRSVRTLDLHAGLLWHEAPSEHAALQFSSLARPGVAVLRAFGSPAGLGQGPALLAPAGAQVEHGHDGDSIRVCDGPLEATAAQRLREVRTSEGPRTRLERVSAYTVRSGVVGRSAAKLLGSARAAGRERVLVEHRQAWAKRWEDADVQIDGDPDLQLAVRVALYHLITSVADRGEAAVGARGLSGNGYRGHVFWDSDVFVLPFLAATHPASARAILEYRVRRLPAALAAARALGRRGARFAWESAASGDDVTPRWARNRAGQEVAIHTGEREEHIVADVAWAAGCYLDWTADKAFAAGAGRELLIETARYWASRIERDGDGSAHVRRVIGPDEYHELVDDNAYTNVMARWNLRRACAATTDAEVDPAERRGWVELADALVDGYSPDSGLYEQFAGFTALEPLVIAELAERPLAADLLLTPERVERAQVIKQADVLMLHHLVPDEVVPGSLEPNLRFYEPRTAHASTLSPGIHAALFARAKMFERALSLLTLAARIDLDDISASSAAGVHLAAMGTVWQALAYGFLGARPEGASLRLDPRLPPEWDALEVRLRYRGARLQVRVTGEDLEVSSDRPVCVKLPGSGALQLGAGRHRLAGALTP